MTDKLVNTIWGIHAGKIGEADSLFLKKNIIALGWQDMGNLADLPNDREAFKKKLMDIRQDKKDRYYWIAGGQLYRFVHEAKNGDYIVYPSKIDKKIHIGQITESYKYEPKANPDYPQQRSVKWLNEFSRTKFSQGALYEIGAAMSFFQVKNYADEFIVILSSKKADQPAKEDETVSYVAEEIEQNTMDFVLKTITQELKGHALEELISHLLNVMGYKTRLSPEGPDSGIDIIAHKDELGFEPPIIKVQVKSKDSNIGEPEVSQLYGKVGSSEYGMFIALGSFTNQARSFARNKTNLRLFNGEDLVNLILQHYENLNSKYKGLLPLKKVYVPESLEVNE